MSRRANLARNHVFLLGAHLLHLHKILSSVDIWHLCSITGVAPHVKAQCHSGQMGESAEMPGNLG